jgi:hypothetical protein
VDRVVLPFRNRFDRSIGAVPYPSLKFQHAGAPHSMVPEVDALDGPVRPDVDSLYRPAPASSITSQATEPATG